MVSYSLFRYFWSINSLHLCINVCRYGLCIRIWMTHWSHKHTVCVCVCRFNFAIGLSMFHCLCKWIFVKLECFFGCTCVCVCVYKTCERDFVFNSQYWLNGSHRMTDTKMCCHTIIHSKLVYFWAKGQPIPHSIHASTGTGTGTYCNRMFGKIIFNLNEIYSSDD